MKRNHILSLTVLVITLAACASSKETPGVWVNKEKIQGKSYSNFFVIVMTADIEARVRLENDIAATIISSSATQLVVTVPTGATTGNINIVKTEVGHLMVPIKNSEFLSKAVLRKSLLKEASSKFGFEGCYLFTTEHGKSEFLAETRFFNPSIGIDEDPATGTAAGPLTGYLENLGYVEKNQSYRILQGAHVSRPSVIETEVVDDGIWISGSSIIVMEGVMYLD